MSCTWCGHLCMPPGDCRPPSTLAAGSPCGSLPRAAGGSPGRCTDSGNSATPSSGPPDAPAKCSARRSRHAPLALGLAGSGAGRDLRTWMGPAAGWPSSTMRSLSSSSLFTLCSWPSSSYCLKCCGRMGTKKRSAPRRHWPPCRLAALTDLVLEPQARGVGHEVAPVLLQDAALLLGQDAQLPRAGLQVRV